MSETTVWRTEDTSISAADAARRFAEEFFEKPRVIRWLRALYGRWDAAVFSLVGGRRNYRVEMKDRGWNVYRED